MYWIKLNTTIYDDPRWIALNPDEAESTENIYIRLLVLAGISDAGGRLIIFGERPHTITTIAALIRRDKAVVGRAMNALIELGFIKQDGCEYAISNWERLQFKADAKTRERDRKRKRKSTPDSTPDSAGDKEKDEEKENNNCAVVDLAKSLLQIKLPQISTSMPAIEAVATALASKGENYVVQNIEYVRAKAKDNPAKYLFDALLNDYAGYQQKSEQQVLAAAIREQQTEIQERKREKENEELRQWYLSSEGQAELARLRDNGFTLSSPPQGEGG